MRILVDENIPRMTVALLCDLGHDVLDIRGTAVQGMADNALWKLAQSEWRVLITTDKGFTVYRGDAHAGILVVRLRQPNRLKLHQSVMLATQRVGDEDWPGLLVVIRDATISTSRSGSQGENSPG